MEEYITSINQDVFETEVLQSEVPSVVMFYSIDCPPCNFLKPLYQHAAQKYKDNVKFFSLLRQQNYELAQKLKINSSPTLVFYKNGKESCQRLTGYIQYKEIRESLKQLLEGKCVNPKTKRKDCDALVLGGGPAGLTSAIYLARARLKTVIVDEGPAGGQVLTTYHVANYPGTNGVVRGNDLMGNMIEQAMSFGAEIDDLKEIKSIDLSNDLKYIQTEDTDYYTKSMIISTGAEPKRLPAEGEREFRGRGVHYCATCDGALYQDKKLIVVGGGNSALQEALFLTRFTSQITLIHQFDKFQASQVIQDEIVNNKSINIVWNSQVKKIFGDNMVKGVDIENIKSGEKKKIETDGIFVYIGMQPKTNFLNNNVKLNDQGYILVNEELRTNIEGVYAAGDVREKKVRQIATAVGDGALAAMMVEKYVKEKFS